MLIKSKWVVFTWRGDIGNDTKLEKQSTNNFSMVYIIACHMWNPCQNALIEFICHMEGIYMNWFESKANSFVDDGEMLEIRYTVFWTE